MSARARLGKKIEDAQSNMVIMSNNKLKKEKPSWDLFH